MLHLINILCQTSSIPTNKELFEEFLLSQKFKAEFKELINYKQPDTGDNILNYASRIGNLNLIRTICENYSDECPKAFIDYSNNDGKSGLHEVSRKYV